jgi:hypothetical protein
MKLKFGDSILADHVSAGASYRKNQIMGFLAGKVSSEIQTFGGLMNQMVSDLKNSYSTQSAQQMVNIRDFFKVKDPIDCINKDINCLAEDWDVAFTVSGPLVFPDSPNYKILVIGIDHAEAKLTTLGLFDSNTNQEVVRLPKLDAQGGVYMTWLARNCSQTKGLCTEVPYSVAPGATHLYLRERVYGIYSYDNLIAPFVFRIRE